MNERWQCSQVFSVLPPAEAEASRRLVPLPSPAFYGAGSRALGTILSCRSPGTIVSPSPPRRGRRPFRGCNVPLPCLAGEGAEAPPCVPVARAGPLGAPCVPVAREGPLGGNGWPLCGRPLRYPPLSALAFPHPNPHPHRFQWTVLTYVRRAIIF